VDKTISAFDKFKTSGISITGESLAETFGDAERLISRNANIIRQVKPNLCLLRILNFPFHVIAALLPRHFTHQL
jgi:hypothetical protein